MLSLTHNDADLEERGSAAAVESDVAGQADSRYQQPRAAV